MLIGLHDLAVLGVTVELFQFYLDLPWNPGEIFSLIFTCAAAVQLWGSPFDVILEPYHNQR